MSHLMGLPGFVKKSVSFRVEQAVAVLCAYGIRKDGRKVLPHPAIALSFNIRPDEAIVARMISMIPPVRRAEEQSRLHGGNGPAALPR